MHMLIFHIPDLMERFSGNLMQVRSEGCWCDNCAAKMRVSAIESVCVSGLDTIETMTISLSDFISIHLS
jgi:hypothetical protein